MQNGKPSKKEVLNPEKKDRKSGRVGDTGSRERATGYNQVPIDFRAYLTKDQKGRRKANRLERSTF